jgi:hypothetical protein
MLKLYTNYGFHELFLNYTDVCIYLYLYIESDPSRQIWKVTIFIKRKGIYIYVKQTHSGEVYSYKIMW